MPPTNAVGVAPDAEGFVFLGIGAEAQDVAVEVFDLHLQRPLEILGRVADFCAGCFILTMQSASVLYADPYPHAVLALVVVGQKNRAGISSHASERIARAPAQFEAKSVHVV